jgi:transcription antitermination factor NusG
MDPRTGGFGMGNGRNGDVDRDPSRLAADWHVVQTAPRCELHVAHLLRLQGHLPDLPEFPRAPGTRGGSVRDRRSRLVFPGYLFLKVPVGFRHWEDVRWAPGVRRILLEGDKPAIVADEVMEHLRHRLADLKLQAPGRPRFVPGQPVVIERGPLAAVDAIFDCELDRRSRVQVLVQMMGRRLPVVIDVNDVRQAG